jgi:hypothetical protein
MRKLVVLAVLSGACFWAPPALASGGSSIASAPTIVYGQQEFGNTAMDNCSALQEPALSNQTAESWWLAHVTAGDRVTIDFEGTRSPARSVYAAELWPVGTTDFTFPGVDDWTGPETMTLAGENGKAEMVVNSVPRSGMMPLVFADWYNCDGPNGGPYDFTAYVLHRLVLSMSARSNRRQHRTYFYVGAHNPDGVPVSNGLHPAFQLFYGGKWHPVGTHVKWTGWDRGKWWRVRAQVSGSGYLTATKRIRVKGV